MNGRKKEQDPNGFLVEKEVETVPRKEAIQALARVAEAPDPEAALVAIEDAKAILADSARDFAPLLDTMLRRIAEAHRLQRLAGTDPLTGVANRRGFELALEREMARHRRTGEGLAILLLDLDDLKPLNDQFGHAAGDEAIRAVASCCDDMLRKSDLVARLGGDEFACLLPGADEWVAISVARRLRVAIERIEICGMRLRVSLGASVIGRGPDGDDDLVAKADAALYADKVQRKGLLTRQPLAA